MKGQSTLYRIKQYLDYKGISNREFEKSVGYSNGAFASQLKNNRTIGVDKLENILNVYPELDPGWLLTSKGKMIKSEVNDQVAETRPQYSKKGIPLIPLDAMAGISNGSMQVMDYNTDKYIVPEFDELHVDFMIKVKGSSMMPKYNSGDIVACKKLIIKDAFFQWNKPYVLDTVQGPIIKRIHQSDKDEHILCVSENRDYKAFDLHLSELNALALVVGVIRLE